ncbi:carboxypeptidase regulatory-like domain-containing protein [candidate division KSB1 bacterium]|nr:carboxypeptidase regulatory-like domain-containing protein [candidate division KSB1 bacterium]
MRSKTLIATLLMTLLIFSATLLFAGTTGKITGKVTDAQNGDPLPGVNVLVEGTMMGAATDLDGEYIILNVPPGIYSLRATMIGYSASVVENVRVSIDLTTTMDIKISSSVLDLGEEVTVVAEREVIQKDMTSSLAAVSSDQIASMPVQEIADVLELQAGLVRDNVGGIHVRGGRSGEVAFWIDGIAATDVYGGDMGVEVENSSVQELQLISGTFNAEYGQAMSGIINIVTKDGGPQFTGEISGYVGDYLPTDGDREFGLYDPIASDIAAIRSPHPDSVKLVNPLDDFNNIFNIQGSLSGPIPILPNLTFFSNFRYFTTDGYRYGMRWFTPQGEKGNEEIVPMEPFRKITGQFKLAYQLTPSMKLTYNILGNDNEFRWYDRYYKYNPDGDYQRFENSMNHILGMTHVLSSKTFYDLKVSYFDTEYQHYVYENPLSTVTYDSIRVIDGQEVVVPIYVTSRGYVHPDSVNVAPASWSFNDGGTKMQHFERNTKYFVGKIDLTSQVTKRHQVKAGFETRFYDLTLEEFDIIPARIGNDEVIPFQPSIPAVTNTNHNNYEYNPFEFSAYAQDKIELKSMIVNLGLRFDYFDPDGRVFADPKDPNINDPYSAANRYVNPTAPDSERVEYTLAEREKFWWNDVSAKYQFSPRFGIAYPITDRGVIHFSYGHFFQMPSFKILYGANDGSDNANPDLEVAKTSSNAFVANADLKPQKTVMYELGLQQQLTDDVGFDLTMFYRDIRDWIGSSTPIDTYIKSVSYFTYVNKDYSNVRGVTFSLNKRYSNYLEAALDYTYMVAEGTASNPQDEYNDILSNEAPRIQIIPLGWDQRHTLNGHISFGERDWRATLLGRFWTGTPYTPSFAVGEISGTSAFSGLAENSARKPSITTFDLKFFKAFEFGKMRYTLFANIYNLLDARGQTGVYSDTGDADYTLDVRNAGNEPKRVSLLDDNVVHTEYYIEPRQVQIGLSIGF